MRDTINLDNNYYLKILNKDNLSKKLINIEKITLKKALEQERLLLRIDFKKFEESKYKKILRKLLFVKKVMKKKEIGLHENSKILLGYIINYNEKNKKQNDFILGLNAIFYNTRYDRYEYIYDSVCEYLDGYFYGKNLCDFKNNKCGEKRKTTSVIGCCRHYKNKLLGPILPNNFVQCEYLIEKKCKAKCISCKLYTCDYLNSKGVKFRIKDILLLNTFFNPLQKYFIKISVYTPKDKIIKRLMRL